MMNELKMLQVRHTNEKAVRRQLSLLNKKGTLEVLRTVAQCEYEWDAMIASLISCRADIEIPQEYIREWRTETNYFWNNIITSS